MNRGLSSLLLLLAACGRGDEPPVVAPPAFTAEDERLVAALSAEYGRAWVADDTVAVMSVFAPDAVLIPHLGNPHTAGRDAIREHFFPPGGPPAPVIRYDRQSSGISGTADMAWDRGGYALAMVFQGDTLRSEGNYLAVARRQSDGDWRWVAYTWNHR